MNRFLFTAHTHIRVSGECLSLDNIEILGVFIFYSISSPLQLEENPDDSNQRHCNERFPFLTKHCFGRSRPRLGEAEKRFITPRCHSDQVFLPSAALRAPPKTLQALAIEFSEDVSFFLRPWSGAGSRPFDKSSLAWGGKCLNHTYCIRMGQFQLSVCCNAWVRKSLPQLKRFLGTVCTIFVKFFIPWGFHLGSFWCFDKKLHVQFNRKRNGWNRQPPKNGMQLRIN